MILLASASPRRTEILRRMGVPHGVQPSQVDEDRIAADHPRTFALRAAYAKAADVAARAPEGTWVLGADTVVTRQLVLFQKPRDASDARRILATLAGQTHEVITGLALARAQSKTVFLRSATTRVTFHPLTAAAIDAYIATGEPLDKAGAYGIQGHGAALVAQLDGDYWNVVGLPCGTLLELLEEAGVEITPRPVALPAEFRSSSFSHP